MKKIILVYGCIAGFIVTAMIFITIPLYKNGMLSIDNGEVVGYTTMVVAMSMIFFGIKSYRDNYLGGVITFGRGLQTGLLIALIASLIYAMAWEVNINFITTDFMEQYARHVTAKAKESNMPDADLKKMLEKMAAVRELYKNPVTRFSLTLAEILPVGIVIALISAAILRKKEILPAN